MLQLQLHDDDDSDDSFTRNWYALLDFSACNAQEAKGACFAWSFPTGVPLVHLFLVLLC